MKLFNILKKVVGYGDQTPAPTVTVTTSDRCLVKVGLTEAEFAVMCKYYYRGYTSYKAFLKHVFLGNVKKTMEVMDGADEKARAGCYIDSTYVRFYVDNHSKFIEIPFDVYSDKRDLPISMRNTKIWNKNNLLRILKVFPDYTRYDDSLISEQKIK